MSDESFWWEPRVDTYILPQILGVVMDMKWELIGGVWYARSIQWDYGYKSQTRVVIEPNESGCVVRYDYEDGYETRQKAEFSIPFEVLQDLLGNKR